jgi:arginine repressor
LRAVEPLPVFGAVREIVTAEPAATMKAIVDRLTERGLTTRNGQPSTQTQVARVIKALGLERIDGPSKAARS